ncbi:MAG: peptide-methionine (S)-S-oxide reductase MsrA [Anaerolineae bacterium]|nr:peptide-methionine (S)-S-oxide reductase MsrA [Gemmatimonadaceae bacterium]
MGSESHAQAAPDSGVPEQAKLSEAIFAGGCFWCMEPPFDKTPGVVATVSGYTGGSVANPTYGEVSGGRTGHYEALKVTYDPSKVTYPQLLEVFWRNIDPLDLGGQFCDRGNQYRAAIFYRTEEQKELAESSRGAIEQSGKFDKPIVIPVVAAASFYPAEDYHQDYYRKNPIRYRLYTWNCGRARRLSKVWGAS